MAFDTVKYVESEQQASGRADAVNSSRDARWAVILAGGDGTRLRSLTRTIAGDERPKQFCPILGGETLLGQTMKRVALAVKPEQTMYVLTEHHEPFYRPLLAHVPCSRLVVQPQNEGTAPAILYSLLRLAEAAPDAMVAFFPSDHYFSDDQSFMAHVESAFDAVCARPESVILLGIKPEGPEVEYGWIEPVSPGLTGNPDALSRVRRFWEKPPQALARKLMMRGCLWNSFVMVGHVNAFLNMIRRALPELYQAFGAVRPTLGSVLEKRAVRALYSRIPNSNFSQQVLAMRTDELAVLSVGEVGWSDLGEPNRVLRTLARLGAQTGWQRPQPQFAETSSAA